MTFSPKIPIFGVILVSLLLTAILLSVPGVEAQPLPAAQPMVKDLVNVTPTSTAAPQVMGKATLDLNHLAKVNNIDEADNARWSLVRSVSGASQATVDWKKLRQMNASDSIALPAGASWSFNRHLRRRHHRSQSGQRRPGWRPMCPGYRLPCRRDASRLHDRSQPASFPYSWLPLERDGQHLVGQLRPGY